MLLVSPVIFSLPDQTVAAGSTYTVGPVNPNAALATTLSGAALTAYEGTGNVSFGLISAGAVNGTFSGGNLVASLTTTALAQATITYDYTVPIVTTATFTAHVYTDTNGLGTGTEPALANVTVELLDSSGHAVTGQANQLTNSSGDVSFSGLAPGSYQIAVVTPGNDVVTQHLNTSTINVLAAGGSASASEGVYTPASFTAHVYTDANNNGTEDTGDTDLGGVTVTLLNTTTGTTVGSKTTDSSGNVSFTGLAPDSYQISVPGQAATASDTVTQTSVTSTGGGTQTPLGTVVTLTSGQTAAATEGVYTPPGGTATFTAHVYTDANGNGMKDGSDTDLSGVTVTLVDTTTGTTVGSQATDSNGNVTFAGLAPDSYQISVPAQTATAGDMVTQTNVTSTGGGTQTPLSTVVTLAAGQTAAATEGLYVPATINTHVYTDANGNSSQDGGDTNLAGVTVTLNGTPTGGSAITPQTLPTNGTGDVSFTGLAPGSYTVSVTNPATGDVTTQAYLVGSAQPLASGQTINAIDGLYVPATINTHVYTDANGNHIQDGGDTNLQNVTVTLNGTPTGGSAITPETMTTTASGDVSFTGLAPGSYTVSVTNPATGDVTTQAYLVGSAQPLASGQTINAIDGLYVPATINTHVYTDANGNHIQDGGDANLAGVTVTLTGTPTGGSAIAPETMTTNASGDVSFANLAPGSYTVSVTNPATGDVTTQAYLVGSAQTLASGQTINAIEGVYAPATFSAHVYTDANGDSSQNGSDTNLAGVTVNLLDGSGNPTGRTAVTDASGNVSFAGLAPGSYEIAVVTPTGDGTTQTTNLRTPTVLASGGSASAIEGVYAPATFSAHVYTDANGDSSQNGSDTNLAGVTVQLLDGSGHPTGRTAVTDASGNVSFAGLAPGSYEIAVVTPGGSTVTQATNLLTPVTVASGGSATAVEGLFVPATLTAHVYTDANGDGTQNAGDSNRAGVTVELLDGSGHPTGRTAVTDANGNVSFTGLPPGTYEIAVVKPDGSIVTQASNILAPITLAAGQTVQAVEGVDTTVIAIPTPTPWKNPDTPNAPKVTNPLLTPAIGTPADAPGDFNPLDGTAWSRQLYVEGRNADGGPIPSWLSFDPTTMSFSGSPPTPLKKPLVMIVVIRDSRGNQTFHDVPIISGPSGDQTEFFAQLTSMRFKTAVANGSGQIHLNHGHQPHREPAAHHPAAPAHKTPHVTPKTAGAIPIDRGFNSAPEGRSAFTTQLQAAGRMGKLAKARALLDTWTRIDA